MNIEIVVTSDALHNNFYPMIVANPDDTIKNYMRVSGLHCTPLSWFHGTRQGTIAILSDSKHLDMLKLFLDTIEYQASVKIVESSEFMVMIRTL